MSTVHSIPPIQVHRAGNFCQIYFDGDSPGWNPALQLKVHQLLKRVGTYNRHVYFNGPELLERKQLFRDGRLDGRPEFEIIKRQLFVPCLDGTFQFTRGLLAKIWDDLYWLGGGASYVDHRVNVLPQAQWGRLRQIDDFKFRKGQKEFMAVIDAEDGGIIVCPTGFGKSFGMTHLPLVYPTSRMAFLAPGAELIASLYHRLNKIIPGQVGRIGDGWYEPDGRVILGSVDSVHKIPMEKMQLVVCDEVHAMATDKRLGGLMSRFSEAKFFGLTASHNKRADKADAENEAVFGPVLYELGYQETMEAGSISPIEVHVWDVPDGPTGTYHEDEQRFRAQFPEFAHLPYTRAKALRPGAPPAILKRNAYWENSFRNAVLARATRELQALVGNENPQTLLMCESVEHQFRLREFLPECELVYKNVEDELKIELKEEGMWREDKTLNVQLIDELRRDGRWNDHNWADNLKLISELRKERVWVDGDFMSDDKRNRLRRAFEGGELKTVCANMVWKQGIDPTHLQVFCRADGTTSEIYSIQLPGRLSRLDPENGKDRGYLLDLNDRWSDWAHRRYLKRLVSYKKSGFKIVEHGPLPSASSLFDQQ